VKKPELLSHSNLYAIVFCGLGLWLSYLAQHYFSIPSYVASAGVGFIGSFLPQSRFYDQKIMVAAVYTGSFSSMCSLSYFDSRIDVLTLSALTGLSFIAFSPYCKGFGGKLGSISFVASLAFVFIRTAL
jgi:hypothetical protein